VKKKKLPEQIYSINTIMPILYLYVKTHNVTGLKYLGKTTKNPFEYKGSGLYWKRHITEHGDNVSTEIIGAFDNKDDLAFAGRFWSYQWDIVKSEQWANLRTEEGDGGAWNKGVPCSDEHRKKISVGNKGKRRTEEQRKNYRKPKSNTSNYHKPKSTAHVMAMMKGMKEAREKRKLFQQ
jgi:hypothetical protein